ncbi:hypothetical protein GWC95_15360 [Sediminibacterium roseum]|uniref:Uncharacterized protein n=1 Tax=Sediminibacterium roseum TaxID=1978412 RepID=A0ABX0A275_9BACT|nr:hypothetical protein [Sediminibacterium roseum]NCI51305.1 hypothetical protein [Sediminibacterium roseum]
MSDKLQGLLLGYIRENNPELLQQLDEDDALHAWVLEKIHDVELVLQHSKPGRIPDGEFLDLMTASLKPSRFHYMRDLLEDQFPEEFDQLLASGTLRFEIIQLIGLCGHLFEEMPLRADMEENVQLDYAVKNVVFQHLLSIPADGL